MTDTQIITAAYQDALKQVFSVFFTSSAGAAGNAAAIQQAEQAFVAGVTLARSARDRAIALLP
jgi:hypothetical protein